MTHRPAEGTELFFLDDAAVLFHAPRQELHAFNSMAAVIWCHLEDGKDADVIAAALRADHGVPAADAARYAGDAIHNWRARGLLVGWEGSSPSSPPPPRRPPAGMPPHPGGMFADIATCRLLDMRFRLRGPGGAEAALLAPLFSHLTSADTPGTLFDVARLPEGFGLYRDGRALGMCAHTEGLAPLVYGHVWLEAVDDHGFFLDLHAGAVAHPALGGCLLLPAAPGSGKSTLTAALVGAGWDYLSDEVALLDAATMRIAPVPVPICLKQAGIAPVAAFWPEALRLALHERADGKRVAYLPSPVDRLLAPDARLPARAVLFPRYQQGGGLEWRELPRAAALGRLLGECVALSGGLDRDRVRRLLDWIGGLRCVEMVYGTTGAALDAIAAAFGTGGRR